MFPQGRVFPPHLPLFWSLRSCPHMASVPLSQDYLDKLLIWIYSGFHLRWRPVHVGKPRQRFGQTLHVTERERDTQKGTNAESRTRRNTNTEWKRSSTSLSQPPDNESSRNTAGRSPNPQAGDHKCLILHDKHHQKILPVTRQGFLLESHNAGCLKSLKSYKLEDLIQKHKPGSVFVHLGLEDLQKHKDPEDLASDFKELMDYILVETQVKLCISSILKTKSPRLNDSIASVNRSIFSYSNKLRRESQAARERIFTFNNANVDKEILLSNDGISLNDYGTTKLAARLTHCLNKIQRANQKSSTISRQHNG